jgi:hypothetical protein
MTTARDGICNMYNVSSGVLYSPWMVFTGGGGRIRKIVHAELDRGVLFPEGSRIVQENDRRGDRSARLQEREKKKRCMLREN